MGGQQFGTDTVLLDTRAMNRVLEFDGSSGQIEIEAGIQWPELIRYLVERQRGRALQWGIVQKQTGADHLTIGGSLAANVHGRGLQLPPIIADVECFRLVDADGKLRTCSRRENPELFRLAIGGYGLFGVIASVRLRLAPRRRMQRVVELLDVDDVLGAFEQRIADGCLYGDFQFFVDDAADDFMRRGVFSCYRPVDARTSAPGPNRRLSPRDWERLLYLAHTDKRRAGDLYAAFYLSTSGQLYWSDTLQLSGNYVEGYHRALDRQLQARVRASEVITEIFVPRPLLARFLDEVRRDFREHHVDLIYGTIRLIERDAESFLAWAKESYACVIFNLHTVHNPEGLQRSSQAFRRLIDLAIGYGGSYYLTYHAFATREQVEACYPHFAAFLGLKRQYDPEERFRSDWYQRHRAMFAHVPAPRGRSS